MKDFKIKSFIIFSIFFILFAAVILFTFYDLQSIQAIYKGENFFSTFFSYVGKLPAYIIMFFAASVLLKCVNVDYRPWTFSLKLIYGAIMFFSAFLFMYAIGENFIESSFILIGASAAFGAILLGAGLLILLKVKREKVIKIEKWCFMAIIVTVVAFFAVSGLKIIFGRIRYEDILLNPTKYSFSEWFKINFFGEGSSFPSGHVALAGTLVLMPKLLKTLSVKKAVSIPVYVLCVLFVGATLFSRIIAGKHFPTDVIFSLIILFITYFVVDKILYKNNELEFENSSRFQKFFNLGIK